MENNEIVNLENQENVFKEPKINGFLILPLIGLFLSPIYNLYIILNDIIPVFKPNVWNSLTSNNSKQYHVLWAPTIILELVINSIFVIFPIILIYYYLKKKKYIPKLMIILYISSLLFLFFDQILYSFLPTFNQLNILDLIKVLIRPMVVCLVWIPYFLLSKNVKATFIK